MKNKHIPNPFNEFVKLDVSRDSLGRGQRLRRLKEINEGSVGMTYNYLRHFCLKKFLIVSLLQKEPATAQRLRDKDFVGSDLRYQVTGLCFRVFAPMWDKPRRILSRNFESPRVDAVTANAGGSPINDYITKIDATTTAFCYPPLQFDECIPKSIRAIS